MRELLVFCPLDVKLCSFVVIVMISGWPVSKLFCKVKLNVHLFSGWFSPSVEVFKEHVVQMNWAFKVWSDLVHVWWDVRLFLNDSWTNLSDMHVNHETVVCINFNQLFFGEISSVDVILNITMFVRQNNIRMTELVSWCLEINNSKILVFLVFIDTEVVITFGCDFSVSV